MNNINDNELQQFTVDLSQIARGRKSGVSGLMRVCNDAEFLEESIKSCIDALDELIIVYNNCTDDSPSIIKKMSEQYPDKIKAYEYLPQIRAWNLNEDEIKELISADGNIHTIANYCNYCLSKSTYEYALKIDADQIYYTPRLKELLDCYRTEIPKFKLKDKIILDVNILYIAVARRLKFNLVFFNTRLWWRLVQKASLNQIRFSKPNTSLSGVNVLYSEKDKYIQLGGYTATGCNILPPYNGVGDSQIFRVSQNTYFEPHIAEDYSKQYKMNGSLIERLRGLGRPLHLGLYWIHLNSNRLRYIDCVKENLTKYPERYISIDEFRNNTFMKSVKHTPLDQCTFTQRIIFSIIHNSFTYNFSEFVKSFSLSKSGRLMKGGQS